ncbi:hypothetical protein [Blastopirellula retiformator]|uniref:Uncharacterized protein n=1 Tax=Blastopirellula retiformator TaxID=2527970 RepID=A0A5C5V3G3_9BACT|nr:hypothetical protein [Blastopirellula retiformator]TWT33088.1 hypothetical protein Enr8_29080 [Blastopirellula retiformator]
MSRDVTADNRWARTIATLGCGMILVIGALMTCAVYGFQALREVVAAI